MSSERSRLERKEFLNELDREEKALAERLERPLRLKQAQEEMNSNLQKLAKLQRRQILGIEEEPFIPADLYGLAFNTVDDYERWSRAEAKAFFEECSPLGWTGTPEHIQIMLDYFGNRGIGIGKAFPYIDRRMWKAAWLSLKKDGLFDEPEAPAPVTVPVPEPQDEFGNIPRLPMDRQVPAAYKRETQEAYRGIDPLTGLERNFSQLEVDRMPADLFKKVFSVATLALTRANFQRY